MLATGPPENHRHAMARTIDPIKARLAFAHDPRPYPRQAALQRKHQTWACDQASVTTTFIIHRPAAAWAARWGRPWLFYPLTHLGEGADSSMRRYYTMRHQLDLSRRATWSSPKLLPSATSWFSAALTLTVLLLRAWA